jgi:putative component of toxin-antitoxin plasmid stabilization module
LSEPDTLSGFCGLLLCGGTKGTQDADIKRAIEMAKGLKR